LFNFALCEQFFHDGTHVILCSCSSQAEGMHKIAV
jgi:hypothetical protein